MTGSVLMLLCVLIWLVAYPLIYGQLLSRLFGLNKKLDHWLLFVLHISTMTSGGILAYIIHHFLETAIIPHAFYLVYLFALEGLVWQFLLRDRKMNGFIISLICNAVFVLPIALIAVLWL